MERGLVNSFSVLPFVDAWHGALLKSLIARHPEVRVGAHLSFLDPHTAASAGSDAGTPGPPGLQWPPKPQGLPGLKEHPGHFRDFLALYLKGRYPPARIYREWKTQILSLAEYLGGPERIAHLDSHQHLHVLPGIWPVAVALQEEFGIPRLRVPHESLRRALFHKFPFGAGFQALAALRAHAARGRKGPGDRRRLLGFLTSTCFTVEANRAALEAVLANPDTEYELMVHPALPPDPDARDPGDPPEWMVQPGQVREVAELERLRGFFRDRLAAPT